MSNFLRYVFLACLILFVSSPELSASPGKSPEKLDTAYSSSLESAPEPALASAPASAESSLDKTKVRQNQVPLSVELPELVITGSLEPDNIRRVPANVQVITEKELKRTGARTLSQALERSSAIKIHQQPGNMQQIWIRGLSSNKSAGTTLSDYVLILIDGNRSGTGNPNNIPIDNIERIEVLRGPGSVLYGASALGGVVNIISKKGKGDFKGKLGASAGSYESYNLHGGVSGGINDDKIGYSLAAQVDKLGEYRSAGASYKNSQSHSSGAGATLSFRPTDNFTGHGVFNWKKLYDTGSPGGKTNWSTPENTVKNEYLYGALDTELKGEGKFAWRNSLYASENNFTDNSVSFDTTSVYRSQIFGGRSIITLPLEISELDFGALSLGGEYARHNQKLGGSSYFEPDFATDAWSGFAEYKVDIGPVIWQSGLRYDYYEMKSKADDSFVLPADAETRYFDQLSWNTGAIWWMTDWLGLRGSVGTAYTPPSPTKLAGDYRSWGIRYKGNPDLKAEKSLSYDFGLKIDADGFLADIGYFRTRYKNRIDYSWDFSELANVYHNMDKQYIAGLEGNVGYSKTWDFAEKNSITLAPYFSWEYLTERRNAGDGKKFTIPLRVPKYTALAGLGIGFNEFWLDTNIQMVGDYRDVDNEKYNNIGEGSYSLINSRLSYQPFDYLELFIEGQNLANVNYSYANDYPMPGRTVYAGFNFDF